MNTEARLLNEAMVQSNLMIIRRGHQVRAAFVVMSWLRDLLSLPALPINSANNSLCRLLARKGSR